MSLRGVKKRLEAIEATRGQSHFTFLALRNDVYHHVPRRNSRPRKQVAQSRTEKIVKYAHAIEVDLYDIDSDAAYKQATAYEWGFIHYNQWTPYQLTNENKAELKRALWGLRQIEPMTLRNTTRTRLPRKSLFSVQLSLLTTASSSFSRSSNSVFSLIVQNDEMH